MGTRHLVILPCHSVWIPGPTCGEDRSEWCLNSFQLEGNDHRCFKEHIVKSIDILRKDIYSTLVISGGQTKKDAGNISEASSYYNLAMLLTNDNDDTRNRITTEEFARDSFENTLFSICRYYEIHGYYPNKITIVGFEFKRKRFVEEHLKKALSFTNRVDYVGNMPQLEYSDKEKVDKYFQDLARSEEKNALEPFMNDWYGKRMPLLGKKIQRNPFNRYHGYIQSNSSLAEFLLALQDPKSEERSTLEDYEIKNLLPAYIW